MRHGIRLGIVANGTASRGAPVRPPRPRPQPPAKEKRGLGARATAVVEGARILPKAHHTLFAAVCDHSAAHLSARPSPVPVLSLSIKVKPSRHSHLS
jgi:hypothetical protein